MRLVHAAGWLLEHLGDTFFLVVTAGVLAMVGAGLYAASHGQWLGLIVLAWPAVWLAIWLDSAA